MGQRDPGEASLKGLFAIPLALLAPVAAILHFVSWPFRAWYRRRHARQRSRELLILLGREPGWRAVGSTLVLVGEAGGLATLSTVGSAGKLELTVEPALGRGTYVRVGPRAASFEGEWLPTGDRALDQEVRVEGPPEALGYFDRRTRGVVLRAVAAGFRFGERRWRCAVPVDEAARLMPLARELLAVFGTPAPLTELALHDPDPGVRALALHHAAHLGPAEADPVSLQEALRRALESSHEELVLAAIDLLAPSAPRLELLAEDRTRTPTVRLHAQIRRVLSAAPDARGVREVELAHLVGECVWDDHLADAAYPDALAERTRQLGLATTHLAVLETDAGLEAAAEVVAAMPLSPLLTPADRVLWATYARLCERFGGEAALRRLEVMWGEPSLRGDASDNRPLRGAIEDALLAVRARLSHHRGGLSLASGGGELAVSEVEEPG